MYQNYKNIEFVKPGGLELKDRLVGVQRVTKVTKGGRTFGFSAIVVVGDENGVVGHGLGKSKEVSEAIAKAVEDAKISIPRNYNKKIKILVGSPLKLIIPFQGKPKPEVVWTKDSKPIDAERFHIRNALVLLPFTAELLTDGMAVFIN